MSHFYFEYAKDKNRRAEIVGSKRVNMKEVAAYWKMLTFTALKKIKKIIGRYLIKTRLKWESIVGAGIALGEVTGDYEDRT
jgi:predicted transcriptional regulator